MLDVMGTGKDTPQSALFSLARDIERMENIIAEHHRQIDVLNTSLRRAKNNYNHIHNQLAPISSLPNEMLSAIFEAGCTLPPSGSPERPFEILVSQISQRWRYIAINTPGLWTKITLKPPCLPSSVDMATSYIQRSKVSALDIFVHIDGEAYHTLTLGDISTVCHIILPHADRWHRIHIDCNWRGGFRFFLDQLPAEALRLQCIKIHCTFDDASGEDDMPRHIFNAGAPRLTCILLNGVRLQDCLPPLTAITHLQFHDIYETIETTRLHSLFSGLSALTHLVINADIYTEWTELESVKLPSLHSLHIRPNEDSDVIPGFLMVVAAPALQFLLLEALLPVEAVALAHNIPDTKFPSLHSLTILRFEHNLDDSDVTPPIWQMLIRAFPAVTHFTLSCNKINTFCESLDERYSLESSDKAPLWPQLHTLTLLNQPWKPRCIPDITLICNALSARIASSHPIRKLQLSKSMMSALTDGLRRLQVHVEVEESTTYPELERAAYAVDWPKEYGE